MHAAHLPTHPTLRHPHTGLPLRAVFVSEKTGRVYWPMLGASPDDGEGGNGGQGSGANGLGGQGSGGSGNGQGAGQNSQNGQGGQGQGSGNGDRGFPANTPVEQMTADQQAAYWKDQSRKHEQRNRAYGNLTPEQFNELKDKADKHDKLELELGTDQQRAVAEATQQANDAAAAKYEPQIARSAIHAAAAAAGLNVESVNQALDAGFTDLRKFVDNGEVVTDRVAAYINSIKPDRGNGNGQQQRGPSGAGTGRHSTSQTATARERGKAEADRRFGKKPA